jgi:hypothetical protein
VTASATTVAMFATLVATPGSGGCTVTYTPAGGAAVSESALVDGARTETPEFDDAGTQVRTRLRRRLVHLLSTATVRRPGDVVTIGGEDWGVEAVNSDDGEEVEIECIRREPLTKGAPAAPVK